MSMLLRIALIMAIPVLSVVFSLMTSGLENVLTADNPNWRTIPIYYWLAFWATAWYSIYHFRFDNSTKKLKIYILRLAIKARIKYLASHVISKTDELDKLQKKAIAVWAQLLKDRDSQMASCFITNRRMLRKDNVTCIVTTGNEVNFMFIRSSDKDVYFEVYLPNTTISSMFNSFDREQKVRFERILEESRDLVSSTVTIDGV
jgi:hypothetical protein